MLQTIIIFFAIIISVYLLSLFLRGLGIYKSEEIGMTGGSRSAIFSRFKYIPQYPFISKLDTVNWDLFAKTYNKAGRLKIIVGRPYRNYRMPDGNWGYPWHFPEPADHNCLRLAENRCDEDIVILNKTPDQKLGGLGVTEPKDMLKPSKCFDYVYRQCRSGVDPLLIKVKDIGVYD